MASVSRDAAWNEIFRELQIIDAVRKYNYYDIKAEFIQRYKEPRLMCKVDFRESLPKVMSNEGLSILAINNGTYRIARNSPFVNIENQFQVRVETVTFPSHFISLDPFSISSESAALDVAKVSGMIDLVTGEETDLSIRGRRYCSLRFSIGSVDYPVSGVQVEVDGGYEGESSINLIEAKLGGRNNINIRQLLYPQLYWQGLANNYKTTRSFVFQYQNGFFRFIPFVYDGSECFVDHSKEKVFKISEPSSSFDLLAVPVNQNLTDLSTPFPQADDFEKVIAFFLVVGQKPSISKEEVSLEFDLVPRQIDYYINVLCWMKLVLFEGKQLKYTEYGLKLSTMQHNARMREFARIVFSNELMHLVLHHPGSEVSKTLRIKYRLENENLFKRRMATVKSWISYFKAFFE